MTDIKDPLRRYEAEPLREPIAPSPGHGAPNEAPDPAPVAPQRTAEPVPA